MNAPFTARVLYGYQQRAATFFYERDAAFLVAPLGAGKGAAALTALAWMPIRMTTHDEVVAECDEARAKEAKAILRREMLTLPNWAEGLPLQSEESVCARYTKSKTTLSKKIRT